MLRFGRPLDRQLRDWAGGLRLSLLEETRGCPRQAPARRGEIGVRPL